MKSFDLIPNALSGICSSSPLHIRELHEFTSIPVFNSAEPDRNILAEILCRSTQYNLKSKITSVGCKSNRQYSRLSDSLI